MEHGLHLSEEAIMDILSYIIGLLKGRAQGKGEVELDGDNYSFSDPQNTGDIVIEEVNN